MEITDEIHTEFMALCEPCACAPACAQPLRPDFSQNGVAGRMVWFSGIKCTILVSREAQHISITMMLCIKILPFELLQFFPDLLLRGNRIAEDMNMLPFSL